MTKGGITSVWKETYSKNSNTLCVLCFNCIYYEFPIVSKHYNDKDLSYTQSTYQDKIGVRILYNSIIRIQWFKQSVFM